MYALATREMNFVHAKDITLNHVEKTEEIPLTPVNSETEFGFKKKTGKEVTELGNCLSDMCVYLFCCGASACKYDDVEFDMLLMDFADSLTPEDFTKRTDTVNATADQAPEEFSHI